MAFTVTSYYEKMSDGAEVSVNCYLPYGEIKGVVVLSHGMIEHSMRYDAFGSFLADSGYVFQAHDHRGHGKTAQRAKSNGTGDFGYLADNDGFNVVTDDLFALVKKAKTDFPGKKIILLAHSFGSFIGQNYLERYAGTEEGKIDACILMGSAGPRNALINFATFLSNIVCIAKKKKPSKFLAELSFSGYNSKIKPLKTARDWLSRDELSVQLNLSDDWCGFTPTGGFYRDLFRGLKQIHSMKNIKKIPKDLKIFVLYGDADPVGGWGKTVGNLVKIYKDNGFKVEEKVYQGARHELLFETNRQEVENDILNMINA